MSFLVIWTFFRFNRRVDWNSIIEGCRLCKKQGSHTKGWLDLHKIELFWWAQGGTRGHKGAKGAQPRGEGEGGIQRANQSIPMSTFIPHSSSSIRYLKSRSKYLFNNKYSFYQRNTFLPKPKTFQLICGGSTDFDPWCCIEHINISSSWK